MSGPNRVAELEEQIARLKRELLEARRATGAEAVADYAFETVTGAPSLRELFGVGRDLLVIHNMGASCPYCTLWADGISGLVRAMETRTAIVLCSPDSPEDQAKISAQRGWRFTMVSDRSRAFTEAMGYWSEQDGYWPGVSAFHLGDDGQIMRIAHAQFGPGDDFCATWPMLDLLKDGPAGWEPG